VRWGSDGATGITVRIDPLDVAFRLWTISGDITAGERIVFRARQKINLLKDYST
jgi:hypothetical protein